MQNSESIERTDHILRVGRILGLLGAVRSPPGGAQRLVPSQDPGLIGSLLLGASRESLCVHAQEEVLTVAPTPLGKFAPKQRIRTDRVVCSRAAIRCSSGTL